MPRRLGNTAAMMTESSGTRRHNLIYARLDALDVDLQEVDRRVRAEDLAGDDVDARRADLYHFYFAALGGLARRAQRGRAALVEVVRRAQLRDLHLCGNQNFIARSCRIVASSSKPSS